ncbi:hypothetical protein DL96DRAFT_1652133 [Flagelloscypha sp. PMI_526]|nr:hypothetical protein DL96DRAFT_1652133 [Flagelloscypha sp. PMI_526]
MGLILENHLRSCRDKPTFPELQMSEFKNLRTFCAMLTMSDAYLVYNWFERASPDPWTVEKIILDLFADNNDNLESNITFDWFDFDSMLISRAWMIFGGNFVGYVTLTVPGNIPWDFREQLRKAMAAGLPKASERGMIRFGLRHIASRWMGSTLLGRN